MDTVTVGRVRARRSIGAQSAVAYVGAAGFAVAAAWNALATKGVTMSSEPTPGADVPLAERQRLFFAWFVTTLHQERLYASIAIIGLLCLAAVTMFVRDVIARDRPLARIGAFAIVTGVVLWIAGSLLQLGGHRAVGLMATHGNPIGAVNAVAFSIDMIDDAFAAAAFALIGLGMLSFARSAFRERSVRVAWGAYTVLVGLLGLALAGSYIADGSVKDLLLLAGGVVVLPSWLIWTGRLLRSDDGSRHAS